ncbi:DUF58 domain-containing protein [Chloroflexota bacterium]
MKVRLILFIVPLILLATALAWGFSLLYHLFYLSVLVLLLSYLWVLFGIRGIRIQVRKLPSHCQVGEYFDEEITAFNHSKLPKLLLKVEENTDLPGHHNISVLNLSPKGSFCRKTRVYCQHRGWYSLGSVTVTSTDPFGLFSQRRKLGEPHHVLIYPATLELPFFKSSSVRDFGYGSGLRLISQTGPDASSVREFTTGDSLNHIHWHGTAHTGTLMVKVFDADRSHNVSKSVWVIADMRQTSNLGEGTEATEEYGITIAASLIKKYLDSGMRVGLVASGDQSYFFPPERGEQHLWHMLEALALMKATGKVSVDRLISDEIEFHKGNSIVVTVTPSATKQVVSVIRQLRNRGNSAVVVLLDPSSFGGTVSSINTARSIASTGAQVYIVRKGDELARTLDSRVPFSHSRFI